MTAVTENRTRSSRAARTSSLRRVAPPLDPTPLPASAAVGRETGIRFRPAPARERRPFWLTTGIAGLVALVAAASLPLMADVFSLPL